MVAPGRTSRATINDKADALAKRPAASHPMGCRRDAGGVMQLRPRVLRKPREPLASPETCNLRRRGKSEVDRSRQRLLEQATQQAQPMHPGGGPERDKSFDLISQPKPREFVLKKKLMCD